MSALLDAVREKYPAYKDARDDELTSAIGKKYPQYLERDADFRKDYERLTGTGESAQAPAADILSPHVPVMGLARREDESPLISQPEPVEPLSLVDPNAVRAQRESTIAGGPKLSLPEGAARSTWNTITEEMNNPRVTAPRFQITDQDSKASVVGKEVVNMAAGIPEFFTSDTGLLGAVGGAAAPAFTATVFTLDMLKSLGEQVMDAHKNWDKLSSNEKWKAVTDMGGTGLMAAMAGKHAAGGVMDNVVPARRAAKWLNNSELSPRPNPVVPLTAPGLIAPNLAPVNPMNAEEIRQAILRRDAAPDLPGEASPPRVESPAIIPSATESPSTGVAGEQRNSPAPTVVAALVEKYHDGDIATFPELVEQVGFSAEESGDHNILAAVNAYRDFQREDRDLKGRGDSDQAEREFLAAIKAEPKIEVKPPTQTAPPPTTTPGMTEAHLDAIRSAKTEDEATLAFAKAQKAAKDNAEMATAHGVAKAKFAELKEPPKPTVTPPVTEPSPKFRIGNNPQTYSLLERLPQSEAEKANGEQPVRVRHDKSGQESVVLEQDLTAVKGKDAKAKPLDTPPEAAAKVAEQVKEVAKEEGARPAKEIKDELIARLEKAIETASDVETGKKITIEIPGDGTFTVFNSKKALGDLLKRANKISTATTSKPAKLPASSLGRMAEVDRLIQSYGNATEAAKRMRAQAEAKGEEYTPEQRSNAGMYADEMEIRARNATKPENQVGQRATTLKDLRKQIESNDADIEEAKQKLTAITPEELKEMKFARAEAKRYEELIAIRTKQKAEAIALIEKMGESASEQPLPEGMGGASVGFKPKQAQIEQLKDSFENIDGKKVPLSEKVKAAWKVQVDKFAAAKDAVSQAVSGLKASGDYLIQKWQGAPKIDDLLRAKASLSAELEKRGWRIREFEKQVKKATPSLKERAAIAKWVDAGGDLAELKRGEAEAPAQYKQAYRDAQALSGDALVAAQNIQNYFEARLQEAIDAGVLEKGVEDYIHRIFERDPKQAKKAWAFVQSGILTKNPKLAKKRIFQWDWEAEKAGYKPVQDFLPRIAQYESSLSKAIAAREFIKKATTMKASDGRPIIDIKGVGIPIEDPVTGAREGTLIKPQFNPSKANQAGTPNYRGDYVNREFPALSKWKWVTEDSNGKPIFVQGDVAIHPDFVGRIAALLEPSRVRHGRYPRLGKALLGASSTMKQTMLDLSGFHQVQIAVHALEHKVLPWKIVDNIDFENPDVESLVKGGTTLGGEYHAAQAEGLVGSALTRHVPILGPLMESYHGWLFQDFIPRVKMSMALNALKRNRERYAGKLTDEQIVAKTASEANSAFGELNYTMLERSKTAQDISRMIFLAPDFLEARGRFAAGALEKGGKLGGHEQRAALLLGALTMWSLARIGNMMLNGQPHNEPENAFSLVVNGKAYGLRTVQGDVLHLIDKPLGFWMHRLNPLYSRTALELVTQRDEFGRKRSAAESLWDTVSNVMPISLRSSRERSIWESLSNSMGVTVRRFNETDKAFKLAQEWKAKHGVQSHGEFIYDPEKDPVRGLKIALSQGDEAGAVKELKALKDSGYSIPKLNEYFKRYADMSFTGSRLNDLKWNQTLTDDQKKTVEAARQHKRQIRILYLRALARQYPKASSE